MATRHHNVTGELTKQLIAPGDNVNVTSISLANVDSSATTVDSVVDLYVEKQLTGRFYILKTISIPVGSTLVLEKKDINFNSGVNQFGLFIKLTKGTTFTLTGSINPGNDTTTVTGGSTKFLTELSVGDEIVVSSETRIVTAIASDTSLTINTTFGDNIATDSTPDCNPVAPVDVIIS